MKSTTKKKPASVELRRQLARDLESILNNPECPAELFNDIADNCTTWQEARDNADDVGWRRAPFIQECLEAYQRQEAKRKGGAR